MGATLRRRAHWAGAGAFGRQLVLIVAAGTIARLILALVTHGHPYDMESLRIVRHDLAAYGFDVYRYVNIGNYHWPYAPGYFPWIALSGAVAGDHGHVFEVVVRLPSIAADAALAWLVQAYLGLRGASSRTRLAAAALVALSPVFAIVSGYQGQIDALAILPAVLALFAWERMDGGRRAIVAGLLIGVGGAIKTVPLLMLIALAPTARSWRELARLTVASAVVPLVLLAPFLLAQAETTIAALRTYRGYPGQGGLTLALEPSLARSWLMGAATHPLDPSALTRFLVDHAFQISAAIYGSVALFVLRFRTSPALAATLLWLGTFAFAPAFFFQYLLWGLPFFLMAGYVRATALLQALVAVPLLIAVSGPWDSSTPTYFYVPLMLAAWLAMLVAIVVLVRGLAAGRPPRDLPRLEALRARRLKRA